MALSEAQKRKIEEEEAYRASIRNRPVTEQKPAKKGPGCLGWGIIIFLIIPGLALALLKTDVDKQRESQGIAPPSAQEKKDLNGNVTFDGVQFHIANTESTDWDRCTFTLNGKYKYPADTVLNHIKAGETLNLGAGELTLKDGTRFNPFQTKPKDLSAMCDGRFGMWSWN